MTKSKILICCLFSFFALPVLAQKQGLRFSKGRWEKVLAAAKDSNKLIFVNVYTEWSEACRQMREEIFPLKEVGEKYNTSFINYRIDADWREGELFSRKYRIEGYPTYLFINGDDAVIFKRTGYNEDPKWFLSLADTALFIHDSKRIIPRYQQSYQSRRKDKAFMREYLERLTFFNVPEDTISMVADHYFQLLSPAELQDTVTARLLINSLSTVESYVFEYIVAHQSYYKGISSELPLQLGGVVANSYERAIRTRNPLLFKEADEFSSKIEDTPSSFPFIVFQYRNKYYLATRRPDLLIEKSIAYMDIISRLGEKEFQRRDREEFDRTMKDYISGKLDSTQVEDFQYQKEGWRTAYSRYVAGVMNNTASLFLQYAVQQEDLKKACGWAARAVDMDVYNYEYYTTLSYLYAKVGMKKEAVSTMKTAITLAKQQRVPEDVINVYRTALKDM